MWNYISSDHWSYRWYHCSKFIIFVLSHFFFCLVKFLLVNYLLSMAWFKFRKVFLFKLGTDLCAFCLMSTISHGSNSYFCLFCLSFFALCSAKKSFVTLSGATCMLSKLQFLCVECFWFCLFLETCKKELMVLILLWIKDQLFISSLVLIDCFHTMHVEGFIFHVSRKGCKNNTKYGL